jgi:hypothetical protein
MTPSGLIMVYYYRSWAILLLRTDQIIPDNSPRSKNQVPYGLSATPGITLGYRQTLASLVRLDIDRSRQNGCACPL